MDATSVETPISYIDETNFNLFISRSQGRAEQGARVNFKRPNSKGKNIHSIGVIRTNGFSQFRVRRGSFTHELANNFIEDILRAASNFYQRPVAVVIDNAPCHSRIEEVFGNPDFSQNSLLRLAPYSPMLNPIELIWSVVKSAAKQQISLSMPEILTVNPENGVSMTEQRAQRLEAIINDSCANISRPLILNCIASVQRHFARVLNMEDVEF